jgi:putative flippase GtrA
VLATAVDYGLMVAFVEVGGLPPVKATALGALGGAITSFTMNRYFTYRLAATAAVSHQAWRYALVSLVSLALNTAGEYLFHNRLHVQYFVARIVTSVIVSNAWNYPMQRFFVFSTPSSKNA